MKIEFDPAKEAQNQADRGLSLTLAIELDWATALVTEDRRRDYGEVRYSGLGMIDDRLIRDRLHNARRRGASDQLAQGE